MHQREFADLPTSPLVTVFILNWNRKDELLRAIESVRAQTYRPFEILVVDNGSTDGSAEAVRQACSDVQVVELDRNYGCPGGRNRGIPHCRGELIFYMDNDALLHRQAVERAVATMARDSRIGVVGGVVRLFKDDKEVDLACPIPQADQTRFSGDFKGGICLHRRNLYDRVGFYPDDYVYAGEEANLAMRALDQGILIVEDPGVILWHRRSEVTRDKLKETLMAQAHQLANHFQLWPVEMSLFYAIRSLFVHPMWAIRNHVFWRWLIRWPVAWWNGAVMGLKRRGPIQRRTIKAIYNVMWKPVRDPDEVFIDDMTYGRFLARLILKSGAYPRVWKRHRSIL